MVLKGHLVTPAKQVVRVVVVQETALRQVVQVLLVKDLQAQRVLQVVAMVMAVAVVRGLSERVAHQA